MFKFIVKRMDNIGLARKVRARVHHAIEGRHAPCLKLLRQPVDGDWQLFSAFSIKPAAENQASDQESDNASDGDLDEADEGGTPLMGGTSKAPIIEVSDDVRTIPQWTSERHLNNLIYDLIDTSGSRGLSTKVFCGFRQLPSFANPLSRILNISHSGVCITNLSSVLLHDLSIFGNYLSHYIFDTLQLFVTRL